MRILYFRGYGDGPGGTIPDYLEKHGWQVATPELPYQDFGQCLLVGQTAFDTFEPDTVVGYSQGAAVAMNINTGSTPLALVSPSWRFQGNATTIKNNAIIINSENDELVSLNDCRELLRSSGLPDDRLIIAGEDHGIFDREALAAIVEAIERLQSC